MCLANKFDRLFFIFPAITGNNNVASSKIKYPCYLRKVHFHQKVVILLITECHSAVSKEDNLLPNQLLRKNGTKFHMIAVNLYYLLFAQSSSENVG